MEDNRVHNVMQPVKLIGFSKSHLENKKYDAILVNKNSKKIKLVPFGSSSHQQYRDSTGLNLYSHLDHLDEKRKENYFKRFGKDAKKYTPKYFSHKYLWT